MVARDLRPFFFPEEPEAPFRALQVQGRCLMAMEAHTMLVRFLLSSFVVFPFFVFIFGVGTCTHWHVITLMGNVTSDQYMCECCHLQRETDICVNAVFCNAFPSICSVLYIYTHTHSCDASLYLSHASPCSGNHFHICDFILILYGHYS